MNYSNDDNLRSVHSSAVGTSNGREAALPFNGHYSNGNRAFQADRSVVSVGAPENRLLSSLDRPSLLKLLPYMERVTLKDQELLISPEQKIQHVYFLESAVVSETQILEDGRTIEVSMTGRESAIGLPSVFENDLCFNWTHVTIPGRALRIKADLLREIMTDESSIQKTLLLHLNSYLKQLTQRIVCQSYHSVEERFCAWLLRLDRKNSGGGLFLTQEKIARLLGVHRPSVTHIALKLRSNKSISYARGRVYILNRKNLESYACSCYLSA